MMCFVAGALSRTGFSLSSFKFCVRIEHKSRQAEACLT
jgi:hypothetical protein